MSKPQKSIIFATPNLYANFPPTELVRQGTPICQIRGDLNENSFIGAQVEYIPSKAREKNCEKKAGYQIEPEGPLDIWKELYYTPKNVLSWMRICQIRGGWNENSFIGTQVGYVPSRVHEKIVKRREGNKLNHGSLKK